MKEISKELKHISKETDARRTEILELIESSRNKIAKAREILKK